MEEEKKNELEETPSEVTSEVETATPAPEAAPEAEAPEQEKKGDKKEKPMTKKKRIANAILLGVQIAFVVIAMVICIVMILNPKTDVSPLGIKLLPVGSNSMEGDNPDSFSKGALVIGKNPPNGGEGLAVGTIITFKQKINGKDALNTHRIVRIETDESGKTLYYTQGDNRQISPSVDTEPKTPEQVLSVYYTHFDDIGYPLLWIRDGYHFIYVIIIPLALLLIYNIYLVAQIVVEAKMKKAKAAAAATARANLSDEEIFRLMQERGLLDKTQDAEKKDNTDGE